MWILYHVTPFRSFWTRRRGSRENELDLRKFYFTILTAAWPKLTQINNDVLKWDFDLGSPAAKINSVDLDILVKISNISEILLSGVWKFSVRHVVYVRHSDNMTTYTISTLTLS